MKKNEEIKRGLDFIKESNFRAASLVFIKHLKTDPLLANFYLGICYTKLKEDDNARSYVSKAIQLAVQENSENELAAQIIDIVNILKPRSFLSDNVD